MLSELNQDLCPTQYLISDALWEKIEPLLPVHKSNHPLGTHRKRVDNRDAMNGIFLLSERGVSGMRLTRRAFAPLALRIVVFKSGEMQVYLSDFGRMV